VKKVSGSVQFWRTPGYSAHWTSQRQAEAEQRLSDVYWDVECTGTVEPRTLLVQTLKHGLQTSEHEFKGALHPLETQEAILEGIKRDGYDCGGRKGADNVLQVICGELLHTWPQFAMKLLKLLLEQGVNVFACIYPEAAGGAPLLSQLLSQYTASHTLQEAVLLLTRFGASVQPIIDWTIAHGGYGLDSLLTILQTQQEDQLLALRFTPPHLKQSNDQYEWRLKLAGLHPHYSPGRLLRLLLETLTEWQKAQSTWECEAETDENSEQVVDECLTAARKSTEFNRNDFQGSVSISSAAACSSSSTVEARKLILAPNGGLHSVVAPADVRAWLPAFERGCADEFRSNRIVKTFQRPVHSSVTPVTLISELLDLPFWSRFLRLAEQDLKLPVTLLQHICSWSRDEWNQLPEHHVEKIVQKLRNMDPAQCCTANWYQEADSWSPLETILFSCLPSSECDASYRIITELLIAEELTNLKTPLSRWMHSVAKHSASLVFGGCWCGSPLCRVENNDLLRIVRLLQQFDRHRDEFDHTMLYYFVLCGDAAKVRWYLQEPLLGCSTELFIPTYSLQAPPAHARMVVYEVWNCRYAHCSVLQTAREMTSQSSSSPSAKENWTEIRELLERIAEEWKPRVAPAVQEHLIPDLASIVLGYLGVLKSEQEMDLSAHLIPAVAVPNRATLCTFPRDIWRSN
jgi:hypothetical protein